MISLFPQSYDSRSNPHLDDCITTRGNRLSIGRPGHHLHGSRLLEGEKFLIRDRIPDLNSFISTRIGKTPSIRRPGQDPNGSSMPVYHDFTVSSRIPRLNGPIFSSTGNARATPHICRRVKYEGGWRHMGRPGGTRYLRRLARIHRHISSRERLPDLHRGIHTTGDDVLAIE